MAKKKYKQLHIPKDAPDEVKEHIKLCQVGLNIIQDAKVKKAAGNFTIKDLKALAKKNMRFAEQFPVGDHKKVGIPTIKNLKDLKAAAAKHQKDIMTLLKKNGGSTITTKKEFKELVKKALKNPQTAGEEMIEKARIKNQQKRESQEQVPEEEPKVPSIKSERDISFSSLFQNHLVKIVDLLRQTKLIYYDLWLEWPTIEKMEKQFGPYFDIFEVKNRRGVEFLMSYVKEEADDDADEDELEEKKLAAALTLATIDSEVTEGLDQLISYWREDEAISPTIIKACKYSGDNQVEEKIKEIFSKEDSSIQAGCIEILDYRQVYESDKYQSLLKSDDLQLHSKILRADANSGIVKEWPYFQPLLEDPEAEHYEYTILSGLIAGKYEALQLCRNRISEAPEKVIMLPLYLACSGIARDYTLLLTCLDQELSKEPAIYALGQLGLPKAVPVLLEMLENEDWQIQRKIIDSLELIVGTGFEFETPEIIEGPEGKEYEVTVETGYYKTYSSWWIENQNQFDFAQRYRRGQLFDLGSCINEMNFSRGNHWSRQFSYFELQIRTGVHLCRFEADWYVAKQKMAIETWQLWFNDHQHKYSDVSWLFSGK